MSGGAVSFDCVSVGYGDGPVVHDVTLEVRAGEVVGLVGPNGAGKTTCLRAVTRAADVIAGRLTVLSRAVGEFSARELAAAVGVLPQSVAVDFSFTAREFVAMGRNPRVQRFGRLGAADAEVVSRVMDRTDTTGLAGESADTLSGGDLQRLALAQALAQEPAVLLLDEPTSHLDVNHRLQVLDLVRDLADEGMAVLGVFHDLDLAARYSDRIAVLAGGTIVADGPPQDVVTPSLMGDVFGVRAVVDVDAATGTLSVTPLLRDADVAATLDREVLVVGGSGSAAWLMRRLVLDGYRVTLAGVADGDTDLAVARVLGLERVELSPFGDVGAAEEARVRTLAERADGVIVAGTPFGRGNVGNLRAVTGAAERAILVGSMDAGRDFTGGEATALWETVVERGGRCVADEAGALGVLKGDGPA